MMRDLPDHDIQVISYVPTIDPEVTKRQNKTRKQGISRSAKPVTVANKQQFFFRSFGIPHRAQVSRDFERRLAHKAVHSLAAD